MARQGVPRLRGLDLLASDFARAFPDSNQWFKHLGVGQLTLRRFFQHLGYDGRAEFFSMYACLLGSKHMRVSPEWLEQHMTQLRRHMNQHREEHGIHQVPARVVLAVKR